MANNLKNFDFAKLGRRIKDRIIPNLGLIFAAFVMFLLAMSGLGPLLREYAPDQEKISAEAEKRAEEFVAETTGGSPIPAATPVTMEEPHRANQQVGEWLGPALAAMLTFSAAGYDDHIRTMESEADERARTDFHSFVISSNILDTLSQNNYRLTASIDGPPLLLNKGTVDGRYRWLFEAPMLLTFLPADAKSYTDTKLLNQHVIVTAQVGRVSYDVNTDELMIESFAVKKNPAYTE